MRIIKKVLKPILTITLAVGMVSSAYAAAWKEELKIDFEGKADGSSTEFDSVSTVQGFSAEVKNEALELKSDDLFYYEISDATNSAAKLNSVENAHKITILDTQYEASSLSSAFQKDDKDYYFEGYKDKAKYIEEKSGKKALKLFTYKDSSKDSTVSTNWLRFQVDKSKFVSSEKTYKIEVEYFTEDNTNNVLKIAYPKEDGRSSVTFFNQDATLNTWTKVSKTIKDADFSKYIPNTSESLQVYGNPDTVNYIRSIRITRGDAATLQIGNSPHTAEKALFSEDIYGSVKLSYDMKMPKNTAVKDDSMYNAGKNIMAVDLLEKGGSAVATVLYETDAGVTTISALYSDNEGNDKKQVLYSGDIADKTLNYVITANIDKTYSAGVYEKENLLGEATDISANNANKVSAMMLIKSMRIRCGIRSEALYAVIDNIKVESMEDENYIGCMEDLTAINAELPQNPVTDDFELPAEGTKHGSEIEWASDDSSAIAIEETGGKIYARVFRKDTDAENVKLTATVKFGSYSCAGDFYFTVKSMAGQKVISGEPIIDADNGTASIVVKNLHTTGAEKVTFAVALINDKTGAVKIKEDTKETFTQNQKFTVSGFSKGTDERIEWYLWADDNISLKNNKPTAVTGLEVTNKVRAVELKWNESFDDYDALSGYEVYRDDKLIATVGETKYSDKGMTPLTAHNYRVIPVDTNALEGNGDEKEGKTIEPYYIDFSTETPSENGMVLFSQEDSSTAYYSEHTTSFGGCRKAADKKFIMISVDEELTSLDYAKKGGVVIEVDYYDYAPGYASSGQDVKMMYRKASGGDIIVDVFKVRNTQEWKTAVIKIPEGVMMNSATKNCSVGLRSGGGDPIYIRSVKWMTTDFYD